MERRFFLMGCVFGFLAVAFGAFGAHFLKTILTPGMLTIFETGVRYQFYHAFALITAAFAFIHFKHALILAAGWLFLAGTLIFSGSLYILSISGIRIWGAVTPVGGVLLLVGWICLALGVITSRSKY